MTRVCKFGDFFSRDGRDEAEEQKSTSDVIDK